MDYNVLEESKFNKLFIDKFNPFLLYELDEDKERLPFNIVCVKGWHNLIYDSVEVMVGYSVAKNLDKFKILFISRTVGQLDIGFVDGDSVLLGMVMIIGQLSLNICEQCGERADRRTDIKDYRVLCEKHYLENFGVWLD